MQCCSCPLFHSVQCPEIAHTAVGCWATDTYTRGWPMLWGCLSGVLHPKGEKRNRRGYNEWRENNQSTVEWQRCTISIKQTRLSRIHSSTHWQELGQSLILSCLVLIYFLWQPVGDKRGEVDKLSHSYTALGQRKSSSWARDAQCWHASLFTEK